MGQPRAQWHRADKAEPLSGHGQNRLAQSWRAALRLAHSLAGRLRRLCPRHGGLTRLHDGGRASVYGAARVAATEHDARVGCEAVGGCRKTGAPVGSRVARAWTIAVSDAAA